MGLPYTPARLIETVEDKDHGRRAMPKGQPENGQMNFRVLCPSRGDHRLFMKTEGPERSSSRTADGLNRVSRAKPGAVELAVG